MNKKAIIHHISPLAVTIALIVFALLLGGIFVKIVGTTKEGLKEEKPIVIDPKDIMDDPLKKLQIQYITGEITKAEYVIEERKQICPPCD